MPIGNWILYDNFKQYLGNGTIDWDSAPLKVALVTSSYVPNTTHRLYSELTGELTTSNGYTSGGVSVTGSISTAGATTVYTTTNPIWSASGGSLVCRYAVIYMDDTVNSVVKPLCAYILLDTTPANITIADGASYTLIQNITGVFIITPAETYATAAANSATAAANSATAAANSATLAANSATAAANSAINASTSSVGTSTSSLTIGIGSKSFTTQANKSFVVGQRVRSVDTSVITNWMEGQVTSYNSGTGALVVNVDAINGSGTIASWNIMIAGSIGTTGSVNLDNYLRINATHEQSDIALRLNGDGSVLEMYDGKENVIIESLPRIPSLKQVLNNRVGAAITLTQRIHTIIQGQSNSNGTGYGSNINGGPTLLTTTAFYPTKILSFTNGLRPDSIPTDFDGEESLIENNWPGIAYNIVSGETLASGTLSRFLEKGIEDGNWSIDTAPVQFASCPGQAAAPISVSLVGGGSYNRAITHVQKAKLLANTAGQTYSCTDIVVFQGEADAFLDNTTRSAYLTKFQQLHTDHITGIKAQTGQTFDPFCFFVQVQYYVRATNHPGAIALAQYDMHDGETRFCIGPVYPYEHWDEAHPVPLGRRLLGEIAGRARKTVLVDNKSWTGLRPKQAWSRGAEVYVRFHVPQGPLVLDTDFVPKTQDFGFKIADGGSVKTITDVRVVASDVVKITCSTAITGNETVRYALDYIHANFAVTPNKSASGNLRDSENSRVTVGSTDYYAWNWCVSFDIPINKLNPAVT